MFVVVNHRNSNVMCHKLKITPISPLNSMPPTLLLNSKITSINCEHALGYPIEIHPPSDHTSIKTLYQFIKMTSLFYCLLLLPLINHLSTKSTFFLEK